MAKRKNRTKRKAATVREPGDTPTPEQATKGRAVREFVTHAETNTKAMAHRVAHDPIEKWIRKKYLTPLQIQTINRMQNLWDKLHGQISVTAAYREPLGAKSASHGGEGAIDRQRALEGALKAITDNFAGQRMRYYACFEEIARFGIHPLYAASSRQEALTVVRMIADELYEKNLV